MQGIEKVKKIEYLKYYYEQIIGHEPSNKQIRVWERLDDRALVKTYKAWQDLFTFLPYNAKG